MNVPASYQAVATLDHAFRDDLAISAQPAVQPRVGQGTALRSQSGFNDAQQRFVRPDPNFRVINQYATRERRNTRALCSRRASG